MPGLSHRGHGATPAPHNGPRALNGGALPEPDMSTPSTKPHPIQPFLNDVVRVFHVYAQWLVGLTWWRFGVLGAAFLVFSILLTNVPPFTWGWTEVVNEHPHRSKAKLPSGKPPAPDETEVRPAHRLPKSVDEMSEAELREWFRSVKGKPRDDDKEPAEEHDPAKPDTPDQVELSVSSEGVRLRAQGKDSVELRAGKLAKNEAGFEMRASQSSKPNAAAKPASAAAPASAALLPPAVVASIDIASLRALARQVESLEDHAERLRDDVAFYQERTSSLETTIESMESVPETRRVHLGDFLPPLAMAVIAFSFLVKLIYKGRVTAENQAAQARQTAESEALKRQVVEARMAAMQAQVEPHFLFNTLASIDHLIEVDPPRASQMQKNLIALLRASMPTLRESDTYLGRELAVVRPYLEILKVRMEERLQVRIDVPEGLLSAEFPPMMLQSLVENAIKHGLEPKAEGGEVLVKAEIVHGQLEVTVSDTGLGFGRAKTQGTGVGLANIRERLQLHFGPAATLSISQNEPCGTRIVISVPYRPHPDRMKP